MIQFDNSFLTFNQLKLIKIEIIGLLEILRVIKLITNKFKTIHQVRRASAFINVEKIAGQCSENEQGKLKRSYNI